MDMDLPFPAKSGFFARLKRDAAGGLGILIGLSLPVVIGGVGLAFDINRGLEQRVINQRAADLGALGAAMAYKASSSEALLQPTAKDVGTANGLPSATTVTAAVIADYPNSGDKSVKVTVTSSVPFTLARVLGLRGSYSVTATSYASLVQTAQYAPPCFLALSTASDAFTTTGGATVNAPDCSVAAVGSINHGSTAITAHDVIAGQGGITVNYGSITASTARYAGAWNVPTWNTAVPDASHRVNQSTTLTDPWAANATLIAARTLLGTYTAPAALSNPTTPAGADYTFGWSPSSNVTAYRTTQYGAEYSVPAGTYYINKLTVDGGMKLTFASGSKIYVSNGVAIGGGSTVNFGNSDIYVNGGFDSGSSGVTIGNGDLWLGSGTIKFQGTNTKGTGNVIMNGTLTLGGGQKLMMGAGSHKFGAISLGGGGSASLGDGEFVAVNGVYIDGDSELALGTGNVTLGPASSGYSIQLSGSARMFMGDGLFSANGSITTAGGSRLVFGITTNHYIKGNMTIAGSALFGAGRYTVSGNFTNGTGGTTWPYTSSLTGRTYGSTLSGVSVSGYDMAGVNVTFILGGTFNLAGGAKTKLVAATTSTSGGAIANLLIDSLTTSAIDWTAGSANAFVGAVHFPNAIVSMAGGNATAGSGQCFTLIANKISLTGGATAGTACPEMSSGGTSSSSSIRLVK